MGYNCRIRIKIRKIYFYIVNGYKFTLLKNYCLMSLIFVMVINQLFDRKTSFILSLQEIKFKEKCKSFLEKHFVFDHITSDFLEIQISLKFSVKYYPLNSDQLICCLILPSFYSIRFISLTHTHTHTHTHTKSLSLSLFIFFQLGGKFFY